MKIAVTGACGLLGGAVLARAREGGHHTIAIDKNPAVVDAPASSGHVVDIGDQAALALALHGADAVIHVASLVDLHLGRPQRLYDINVTGVKNVVSACQSNGIAALVHMSSAEVISGHEPVRGAIESHPYPKPHLTFYGETKQQGEEAVLGAADDMLGTCAMRTYGLFGEGDNMVVPSYVSRLVGNRVAQVGDGSGRTDTVYAPNLAHALVVAAEELTPDSPWSGSPFHVTDHAPVHMQQFLRQVTEPLGISFVERVRVPRPVIDAVAQFYELRYRVVKHDRYAYPRLTKHSAKLAFDDYWLDSSRVRDVLGYEPVVSRSEAIRRTQAWVQATFGS